MPFVKYILRTNNKAQLLHIKNRVHPVDPLWTLSPPSGYRRTTESFNFTAFTELRYSLQDAEVNVVETTTSVCCFINTSIKSILIGSSGPQSPHSSGGREADLQLGGGLPWASAHLVHRLFVYRDPSWRTQGPDDRTAALQHQQLSDSIKHSWEWKLHLHHQRRATRTESHLVKTR